MYRLLLFQPQAIHPGEAVSVDVSKFSKPDTYNKVQCSKLPKRFENNQVLGTRFKCLYSNDDSACSISSDFFAKSNKTADCEAKMDVCVSNCAKFVMDSVLRRVESDISK